VKYQVLCGRDTGPYLSKRSELEQAVNLSALADAKHLSAVSSASQTCKISKKSVSKIVINSSLKNTFESHSKVLRSTRASAQ
jgi:hypothetical protein